MIAGDILAQIRSYAVKRASREGVLNSNLYLDENVNKNKDVIWACKQKIEISDDTFMVFVDDTPLFNWSHPIRFYIYRRRRW